ncbi:LysR family transcriptional regulator [Xylophilus rhododendri]|uniref:LysR family transcriptional regulator n=1 Tax=Xylophilus rhododendri TaxID=2697032 RepID=A0A857J2L9_9BURK|nr:LysR family transcriptional regulator [Xylophilus rhododendri]QHI97483.1 LysR family transcriptional regulator [Xylophilus rhododendri]
MNEATLPTGTEIAQLRTFVVIADTLSFARAAERLGVTPSALSQTLRALEAQVGARLLHRTTRSVSLTEAGTRLLANAAPALKELGSALQAAKEHHKHIRGVLRIHCFRVAVDLFITPVLRAFHEAYPEVVLDLVIDDHVVDIVADGFDAAIRVGEVIEKDMVAIRLGPDLRQVALASPQYLARHGCPATPRDLADHACIGWRWPGQDLPYRWEFMDGTQALDVVVRGPLIANSRDFCVRAAAEGIGIAFAIEEAAAEEIRRGQLLVLLEGWSAPFPGFHLCFPSRRQMAPALRAFIDALRHES